MSLVASHGLQLLVKTNADLSQHRLLETFHPVALQSGVEPVHSHLDGGKHVVGAVLVPRFDSRVRKKLADTVLVVPVEAWKEKSKLPVLTAYFLVLA